ncbi:tRNA (adenosine(37)-N6)-dimethylallyltransferase MiaA [Persephonella sp.]|uniref:tRNA (adenosine(37)-N6)-dimethylallyltransferase MiaA n=1 Tax=Persephonella sp. TaxID=2060922 RepID=UPI00260CD502|nr:tRNA (adenosine(37)-N6)-dimethylallyltransferase MiaA [Persephonella sp.]
MKIIVITGLTATGKSEIGVEVAKQINGEIISADSMMVYKYMDIGTAKPTPEDMQGIPHYLIDVVEPDYNFSAKDFIELAQEKINDIHQRGKVPVIVGGTWLYIHTLLYGLSEAPPTDWKIREKLYKEKDLYERLKQIDPEYANKIHPNDKKRIVRALEVYELSGKPFSSFQKEHSFKDKKYDFTGFVFHTDRERLWNRIEKRVDKMFQLGLVDEVKNLMDMGYENSITAKQAIGYKEIIPYLKGEISLEEAKNMVIKNTKDFAKRQKRAFRSKLKPENGWLWIDPFTYTKEKLLDTIIKKYEVEVSR